MAHTTDLSEGFYIIHNGDFSGDVDVRKENDLTYSVKVPFDIIREIYLTKMRRDLVSRLEQLDVDGIEEFLIEGC